MNLIFWNQYVFCEKITFMYYARYKNYFTIQGLHYQNVQVLHHVLNLFIFAKNVAAKMSSKVHTVISIYTHVEQKLHLT